MDFITAVVLAAGKGLRMKSSLPKVLHPLLNRSMLAYVLQAARESGAREQIVVTGYEGQMVRAAVEALPGAADCRFATQEPQLGTGHALQTAMPGVNSACDCLLVLCGDTPLLSAATLSAFLRHFAASGAAAALLSCILPEPYGYGRVIRGENGELLGIVEEKDATAAQKAIREINSGIYCFAPGPLRQALAMLTNDNAQGEYYLTDTIAALRRQGWPLEAVCLADAAEITGINDRVQLSAAGQLMQRRINQAWMLAGVTIIDPGSAYIDADVSIGADTVIEPQTYIRAGSSIGCGCRIGVGTEIAASRLGNGVYTRHAIIDESEIGDNCQIGPFTRIRPGSKLAANVKAGHFVELKKAEIGAGSKIPHLSYVGDAIIGSGVNIGCGSITCNYDGKHKYSTVIGDDAFIGSNTNFVAPVYVGARAVIGAGSTITGDVPDDALAIARAKQVNKLDYNLRKK